MSNNTPGRFQFSMRHVLVFMAAAAFTITATVAVPHWSGCMVLLGATLILLGILMTNAAMGGPKAKTFCIPATIPIIFALYTIGWALGWIIYSSVSHRQVIVWFATNGQVIKTMLLASWLCAVVAGVVCVLFQRMLGR
jgi:lipid-A-disaccharide synthase-like uncharacterized protein